MTEQQTWPDPELGQLATQLRQVEERAIFTHCYGHALNLAVADVVKESRMVRDVLSWRNHKAFEVFSHAGLIVSLSS